MPQLESSPKSLILSALSHARSRLADSELVIAQAAFVDAGDLISFARGMGCDDRPLQVSQGPLAATLARIEVCGIALGFENCNQAVILEDAGETPVACFHSDRGGGEVELLQGPRLFRRPAFSQALCVAAAGPVAMDASDPAPLGSSPSDEDFWRATRAVVKTVRSTREAEQQLATVQLRRSDVLTIIDAFSTRLSAVQPAAHNKTQDALLAMLERAQSLSNFCIDDLAEELRMTRRNLHYCATRNVGVSPKRLVKSMALRNVMFGMPTAAAQGQTIGDLAFEHGFENFSRFCADYRMHFGERPGDTFRRYASS